MNSEKRSGTWYARKWQRPSLESRTPPLASMVLLQGASKARKANEDLRVSRVLRASKDFRVSLVPGEPRAHKDLKVLPERLSNPLEMTLDFRPSRQLWLT
jgi:hypothetical protein